MNWRRPILARLAAPAILWLAAAPLLHAREIADAPLHTLPLSSLSPSGAERILDWRGGQAKIVFDLPPGMAAQNLRLALDAAPGEASPAPHASIEVRLNGSPAAVLRPEPHPFNAQVDFPARYLRAGRNEAVIAFVSPAGGCPAPEDGAWALNLAASRIQLSADMPRPNSPGALDRMLRSPLISPNRIFIDAGSGGAAMADTDTRAAFETWAALAAGVRAPRTPRFVPSGAGADMILRFVADADSDGASFGFAEGPVPVIEIRAPDIESAALLLRDYARAAETADKFIAPRFGPDWTPEPEHAVFTLDRRPERAVLRMSLSLNAQTGGGSQLGLLLNGRPLPDVSLTPGRRGWSIPLPPGLLAPGDNTLVFTPRIAAAPDAEQCRSGSAHPLLTVHSLRIDRTGVAADETSLFGFAAGDFAGARLHLPARNALDRMAQLRLLAEIARRAGRAPDISGVSATADIAPDASAILLAPRALVPAAILETAPGSLHAVLRGAPERTPLRLGSRAQAAGVSVPVIGGGAARFSRDDETWLTLLTETDGSDFAASLHHLADSGMLTAFDGRVMRWTRDEAVMQDRGPWRAPSLRVPPPTTSPELGRTLLFLAIIGGLALGWIMVRARRH